MGWSEDAGLPLWLFIIVVLLPLPTVVLPILVIWRSCLQRNGEQDSPPSEKAVIKPRSKFSAWKAQTFRPFRKTSLPEPKFPLGAGKEKRCQDRKWPEPTQWNDSSGRKNHESDPYNTPLDKKMYGQHFSNLQRASWWSLLRRMDFNAHRTSLSGTTVESNRPSYTSDSADGQTLKGEHHQRPKAPDHDMRWLDTPSAQLTPLTPLELPWSPMSTVEAIHLTAKQPAQPPTLPIHNAPQPRDIPIDPSTRRAQRRETKKLESWLARSHHNADPPSVRDHRRSSALTDSFLQAWTKVYYQYLGVPLPASPLPPKTPAKTPLQISAAQASASASASASIVIAPPPPPPPAAAAPAAPTPNVNMSPFNFMLSPLSPGPARRSDEKTPAQLTAWHQALGSPRTTLRSQRSRRRGRRPGERSWLVIDGEVMR